MTPRPWVVPIVLVLAAGAFILQRHYNAAPRPPARPTPGPTELPRAAGARVMAATTPCSDEGFPYGRPGSGGFCYDCAGKAVGLTTLPDIHFNVSCVPMEGTQGPAPTSTRPNPIRSPTLSSNPSTTPTPRPPLPSPTPTLPPSVLAVLELPRDARAVSHFLLWDASKLTGTFDRYQIQFLAAGAFAPDYEGPFPPASDPGMRDGFVWPCEPPGRPFTGEDCRATATTYAFAYRVHGAAGWSAPRVQEYRVTWLTDACAPAVRTVPPRLTPTP